MLRNISRFSVGCAGLLAWSLPVQAASDSFETCPAARVAALVLPQVKEALSSNLEVTIVAFGSSSTAGFHASTVAQSYPAILQAELSAALPYAHVAVINRGVGGQDAAEMIPRIETDVLQVHPTLVIWQVGANGAIRNRDPEEFRRLVNDGVQTMKGAGIDVVLMDNQRAPSILAAPHHVEIDQAIVEIAKSTKVGLFDRGALMDQWLVSGHPYEQFMSNDGIHHNDHGYRCVARALASAILEGVGKPMTVAHASVARR